MSIYNLIPTIQQNAEFRGCVHAHRQQVDEWAARGWGWREWIYCQLTEPWIQADEHRKPQEALSLTVGYFSLLPSLSLPPSPPLPSLLSFLLFTPSLFCIATRSARPPCMYITVRSLSPGRRFRNIINSRTKPYDSSASLAAGNLIRSSSPAISSAAKWFICPISVSHVKCIPRERARSRAKIRGVLRSLEMFLTSPARRR